MQKEFEREYETVGFPPIHSYPPPHPHPHHYHPHHHHHQVGICQDIISASEEGEEEENRTEEESENEHKSILSERENVQNGDDDQKVDVGEIANKDEKTRVESEKEKSSSKPALLTEEIMSSGFQVSATNDPFGL